MSTKVRALQEKRGWAWTTAVVVAKPPLLALTKRNWIDGEKIPATGGAVLVMNHVSALDPLTFGWYVYEHGRLVRYLAKESLFHVPALKHIMRDAGQIPVARMTTGAVTAFDAAVAAVEAGECLGVYPEGTITRDPDGWPMRGKTGAARIALATGVPVIPIGQWGAQELLPAYAARPRLFPRKTLSSKAGDPVDLDDLRAREVTIEVLHEATDRIMAAITTLVEDLRGEQAPPVRFDPKASGVQEIGNPHKQKRSRG